MASHSQEEGLSLVSAEKVLPVIGLAVLYPHYMLMTWNLCIIYEYKIQNTTEEQDSDRYLDLDIVIFLCNDICNQQNTKLRSRITLS